MDVAQAQRVIESLRKGIPPDGFVGHFTVGRESEIRQLTDRLDANEAGALLLKANYGSGKTHLLRLIRDEALKRNYITSVVTLDCRAGVQFSRMDQIFGAVCRNIEVPQTRAAKGIRPFFDFIANHMNVPEEKTFWSRLSSNAKWDYSDELESPAMYVALRAWKTGISEAMDRVEDWFYQPWNYKGQRNVLHTELVGNLRRFFRDSRQPCQFFEQDVFNFDKRDFEQSWAALRDINTLSRKAGLSGFIVLFDEFEDIITNSRNIRQKANAFWTLFNFGSDKKFPSMSFYAVTPEFINKCKNTFLYREAYSDYDYSRFDSLPTYEMSPLEASHLHELSLRIAPVHGLAYEWDAESAMNGTNIQTMLHEVTKAQIQDRTRYAIKSVVQLLDNLLQGGSQDIEAMPSQTRETFTVDVLPRLANTNHLQLKATLSSSIDEASPQDIRRYKGASGCYKPGGFMVFKDSIVSGYTVSSFEETSRLVKLREQLIQEGILVRNGNIGHYKLSQDYLFTSSSDAASITAGNLRSGPEAWGPKPAINPDNTDDDPDLGDIRHYKSARGCYTSNGFLIFKGSRASGSISTAFNQKTSAVTLRNQLIEQGILEKEPNGDFVFAKNHLFNSSSAAACIIDGNSRSGTVAWGAK